MEETFTKSRKYFKFLIISIISIFLLSLLLPFLKKINHDEFEHIHSAWYIANGYLPFKDFFQNHNPLFWFMLVPAINIAGETIHAVIIIRYFNYIFTIGSIFISYLIAVKSTQSKEVGLLTVFLLFSFQLFYRVGIEIRPDVPQVFFGMLSIYFLICFIQSNKNKYIIFCGLCLSISFLFLQKAVFLIFILSLIVLLSLIKKNISFKAAVCYCFSAFFPLFLFFIYLYITDSYMDYYITNICVNVNRIISFSPFRTLNIYLGKDFLYYIIILLTLSSAVKRKWYNDNEELKIILYIGITLFATLFLVSRPHAQNFMQQIPMFCILSAYYLKNVFRERKLNEKTMIAILAILLINPIAQITKTIKKNNLQQLNAVSFVLENTTKKNCVYDGNIKFNLFRKDLHYFWYSVNKGKLLDSYNLVTNNKYKDYNIYEFIKKKKPKIISDFAISVDTKFISEQYKETEFEHIYIKNNHYE